MFNKIVTYGGMAGFALIVLFGHDLVSYVTTASALTSKAVRSKIPIEFEINRAKHMIEELGPHIHENMVAIAREEIDIEELRDQIIDFRDGLDSQRVFLSKIQENLASGQEQFTRGDKRLTAVEYASFAKSKFERYQTQSQTLSSLQQALETRQQGLVAARKELESLVSAKEQLVAELDSLEARQKMNEVARSAKQASSQSILDDSQLARTRQLIREIETRVRVEERLSATELHFMEEVMPVGDSVTLHDEPSHVATQIGNYLANEAKPPLPDQLVNHSNVVEQPTLRETAKLSLDLPHAERE